MSNELWSSKDLEILLNLKGRNLTWNEIAQQLGKSKTSVRKKFYRLNISSNNTSDKSRFGVSSNSHENNDKKGIWDQQEMIRLHAYLDSGKSYAYIAEKLGRSLTSVEGKSQTTDWNAWHTATFHQTKNGEVEAKSKEELTQQLIDSMVYLSRNEYSRIQEMKKEDFLELINVKEDELPIKFSEIQDGACKQLDSYGLSNVENIELGEGTYIVVGDSHGKHTKRKMFDLIKVLADDLNVNNVIHVGHLLDDDNEISYKWGEIENLVVLAKEEELKVVHKKRNSHNFSYKIVTNDIAVGSDLTITTQHMIDDYAKTQIRNLDCEIFEGKVVVNCHRLEIASKASTENNNNYIMSPGCLCEKHVVRTIRQIDFKDSKTVKLAYHEGFTKYRKMKHNYKHWSQGVLVIEVDRSGQSTIIPCVIKKSQDDYVLSYFDKIYTSTGIYKPDKKIFIHADMHAPRHDSEILDIQEQICKQYKPDVLVNIGDSFDCHTLNHHDIDKGTVVFGDYLQETAKVNHILSRMASWAKEKHIIIGNHERFIQDFVKKFPQLSSILDFNFACNVEGIGYQITKLKEVLVIGDTKFIHGDMVIFNQTGNKQEKTSRTFGHDTFIGHIHYPSIRFGCYSIGFAGQMDQGYNEKEASAWIHGFGLCNQYNGLSFPTTVAIFNKKIKINKKSYISKPESKKNWDIESFTAKIVYEYKKPNN